MLSHLIVPASLLFPVLRISSEAFIEGALEGYVNIFKFITINQYLYVTILLVVFVLVELLGVANSIYGLTLKEMSHRNIGLAFLFGFSSAVLGAMFISSGSYVFFTLCAVSFILISYASVKLMKFEK